MWPIDRRIGALAPFRKFANVRFRVSQYFRRSVARWFVCAHNQTIMTSPTRRALLLGGSALAVTAAVVGSGHDGPTKAEAKTQPTMPQDGLKALFFDIFGTLVDWRTGVAREAKSILKPLGYY